MQRHGGHRDARPWLLVVGYAVAYLDLLTLMPTAPVWYILVVAGAGFYLWCVALAPILTLFVAWQRRLRERRA